MTGFDNFELNPLETLLDFSAKLAQLPEFPVTVARIWYAKVGNAMVGVVDKDLRQAINQEFLEWEPYSNSGQIDQAPTVSANQDTIKGAAS